MSDTNEEERANYEDRMVKRREIDTLRGRVAALEAENERLQSLATNRLRECEQYAATIKDVFGYDWMDRAIKAEVEVERLREALRPFVLHAEHMRATANSCTLNLPDPIADGLVVTDEEVRVARALLGGKEVA